MASNVNFVVVSGNVTRDPELRQTANGFATMRLGLAVNDRHKNSSTGEWEDYTNFLEVTVLGKRAESLQPILTKGMKLTVTGRLRWSQWEKDGQKRSKVEIVAEQVELPPMANRQQDYGYAPTQQTFDAYVPDESVPF